MLKDLWNYVLSRMGDPGQGKVQRVECIIVYIRYFAVGGYRITCFHREIPSKLAISIPGNQDYSNTWFYFRQP